VSVKLDPEKLKYIGVVFARKTTKEYPPFVLLIPKEVRWLFDLDKKEDKKVFFDLYVDMDNKVLVYAKR